MNRCVDQKISLSERLTLLSVASWILGKPNDVVLESTDKRGSLLLLNAMKNTKVFHEALQKTDVQLKEVQELLRKKHASAAAFEIHFGYRWPF